MTVDLRYPLSALVSYHYFRDPAILHTLARGGLRLIGDSGAFSAHSLGATITLDEYAAWCQATMDATTWHAGLDVIGDAAGTWDNWVNLRTLGVESVPTIHYGTDPTVLDRYADEGIDFLGLGGMVPLKSEPQRLLRWCLQVMRYARDNHPTMRFHGWGVTHPDLLMNLPWWSVDSSGFGASYRFGRMSLWDPAANKIVGVNLNGRDAHKAGRLIREHYQTTPDAIEHSTAENRGLVIRVSCRSLQFMEDYMRKRHQVTPPTHGIRNPPALGPSLHYAEGDPGKIAAMVTGNADTLGVVGRHLYESPDTHIAYVDAASGNLRELLSPGTHVHAAIGAATEYTHITQQEES